MKTIVRVTLSLASLASAGVVLAQSRTDRPAYPDRPVRVVVGFAAGGPTDVIARIVTDKLSASLGKSFYVVNQPGAGSNTASGMVATSAADGYTLLVVSTGFLVNPSLFAQIPYDPVKDFAPISIVAVSPNVVTVNPAVPARTLKELIALIRANPGKYSFAAPGVGSTPHLSGEIFRSSQGIDLVTVQFPGAAPAIQSTIGGHTPVAFSALPAAAQQIKDGLLRALAVSAAKRTPTLPDVPTMAEAGIEGQEAYTLTGILAPAGTPPEIIHHLHREIVKLVAEPDVQQRLFDLGFEVVGNSPDEFAIRIKTEMKKWGDVIRAAKIRVE